MRETKDRDGKSLLDNCKGKASWDRDVIKSYDAPMKKQSGFLNLKGNLFDSAITFRARYQRHEDLLALTDLLVLDSSNPRAFAGVLRRLRTELTKLPGSEASHLPLLAQLPAPTPRRSGGGCRSARHQARCERDGYRVDRKSVV